MGRTKEQNAHLHTFLCCPHEQPKEQSHRSRWEQNSHPASEQSTPLVPFTSLSSSCFNTLGPKLWYGLSDPNSLCSKFPAQEIPVLNFLHRTFCFYHTNTFMVLSKEFSLPKSRVRAQSLLQISLSISAGLWVLLPVVTGLELAVSPQSLHGCSAEGTKLEPFLLPHEGMDTHNTRAKAIPCHQLQFPAKGPSWVLTELSFPGKAPVPQCPGCTSHQSTREWKAVRYISFLSTNHCSEVLWFDKAFLSSVRIQAQAGNLPSHVNFIFQQLENPGSPALSSDGTILVPVGIVYLTPVQNRAK